MSQEGLLLGNVSVAIGMPVGKPIPAQTVTSLFATAYTLGRMGIRCDLLMQLCGVIQIARDTVLNEFLTNCRADKLFWIDSDMVWTPETFLRLLAFSTKFDVVAAAYPAKIDGSTMFYVNTEGEPTVNEYGLRTINGLGLGFAIVDRKACEHLAAKAPRVFDGVNQTDMAEVFRVDKSEKGFRRTEDIAFFADLRDAGFTVWCDPSIELGHVGEKEWRGRFADALELSQAKDD